MVLSIKRSSCIKVPYPHNKWLCNRYQWFWPFLRIEGKIFFLFFLPIFAELYLKFSTNAIKVESYHVLIEPMNLTTNLKALAVTFNSKNISNYIIMCSDNPLCYFRAPYIAKKAENFTFRVHQNAPIRSLSIKCY